MAFRRQTSRGDNDRRPARRPRTRTIVAVLLALLVAVGSLLDHYRTRDGRPAAETIERKSGTVTHVVDGDTLDVQMKPGERPVRVRLIGIDAPEVEGPAHALGVASAQYARNRLERKEVTLRMDELQRDHDQYGRLLAYVYLNDELLNESLVRDGMAFSHRTLRCDHSAQLDAAENEARGARRGLWKAIVIAEMPDWRRRWMADRGLK